MKTYVYIPGFEYDSKGPIQIDAIELHARVVGSTNELSVYIGPGYITRGITGNIIYRSTQSSTYQDTYRKYDNVISYSSPFYTEARSLGRVCHGFFYDFILENADGSLHHIIGIHDDPQECVNSVSNMNSKEHDGLFAVEINNPNTDILLDFTFYTKIVGNDAVDINMSIPVTSGYTKICSVSKVYNPATSANGDEGTILPTAPKLQYFDITLQSGYYWEVPVNAGVLVTRMLPENEMSDSGGKKMYKQYSYNRELRRHVLSDSLVCNNMTYQDSTDFFLNFYKNSMLSLGSMDTFVEISRIHLDLKTLGQYNPFGSDFWVGVNLSTFNCTDNFNTKFSYNITGVDLSSFSYLYKHLPSVCILNKLFDKDFYSSNSIYPISVSIDHSKLLRSGKYIDKSDFDYVFDCHDAIYNNSLYEVDGDSLSNTNEYLKIRSNDIEYFSIKSRISYLYNDDSYTIFNSDSAYCRPNDNINWNTTPVSLKNVPYLYASKLIAKHEGGRLRKDGSGIPQYRSTYLLFTLYGNSNNYTDGKSFNLIINNSIFSDGNQRIIQLIADSENKFSAEVDINNIKFSGFYNKYTNVNDALNNVYNNKYVPSGDVTAYLTNMIYIDLNRSNVRFSNLGDYKIIPMFINETHGVDTSTQSQHLVESNVINDNLLANGSKPYEILNVLSEEVVFKTPFEMGYKSSFCNESRFVENTTNPLYIKQKIKLQPGIYAMRVQNFVKNADITATINENKYNFINNALFLFVHEASEVMFSSIQWDGTFTYNNLPDFISGVGLYKININATDIKSILLKDIFSNTSGFYIRNDRDIYDLIVFNSAACAKEFVDFCKKNTSNLQSYYVLEYENDYDDDAIHQIYNFPYLPEQACYDVVAFYCIPVDDVPINIVDILNSNVSEGSSLITQLKSKKARV